jgi:excalibur calcium-binding domain-containing protein
VAASATGLLSALDGRKIGEPTGKKGGFAMSRKPSVLLVAVVSAGALASNVAGAPAAGNRVPYRWKNCTIVNKRYPHGVGRYGAHDKTTGVPVRNFKHSNLLYATAMHYNKGLDRDKDKIACEKR